MSLTPAKRVAEDDHADEQSAKVAVVPLEEDVYTAALSHIIQRDFFPDLPRLRVESEYVRALELHDSERLALAKWKLSQLDNAHEASSSLVVSASDQLAEHDLALSLDQFQAKFTSEDNTSFADILKDMNQQKRGKLWWMYKNSSSHGPQKLLSTSSSNPQISDLPNLDERNAVVPTWDHKAQNALMFEPQELVRQSNENTTRIKQKETVYSATRFNKPTPLRQLEIDLSQAEAQAHMIIHDNRQSLGTNLTDTGKIEGDDLRTIRGYTLVPSTPTPQAATIDLPPLLTWGNIESTPVVIRDSRDSTPGFVIHEQSRRERIGQRLSDAAKKKLRQHGTTGLGVTPSSVRSTTSSLWSNTNTSKRINANGMSTTVQLSDKAIQLMNRSKANAEQGDTALRNSYRGDLITANTSSARGTSVAWSTRSTMSPFSFTPKKNK